MVWHSNQRRGGGRATRSPLPRRLPKGQHESRPSSWMHVGSLRSRSPLESQHRGLERRFPSNERKLARGTRAFGRRERSPPRREKSPLARSRRCAEGPDNREQIISRDSLGSPSEFEEGFEASKEKEEIKEARSKEQEKGLHQRGEQQQQEQQQRTQEHRFPRQRAPLSRKIPGALTRHALEEISRLLVEALGDQRGDQVRPLFLKYCRLHLFTKNVSPGQKREVLTLVHGLDGLVQRDLLGCADLLVQRLKAIELVLNGASWQVAQNIELVPLDQERISSVAEAQEATRAFKSDFKVQRDLGKGFKGKTEEKTAKARRGQESSVPNRCGRSETP